MLGPATICRWNSLASMQVMYDKRSKLGLVGSSFDTSRSDWSSRETTIGPGIDSYYEYLLKVTGGMQMRPVHALSEGCASSAQPIDRHEAHSPI